MVKNTKFQALRFEVTRKAHYVLDGGRLVRVVEF